VVFATPANSTDPKAALRYVMAKNLKTVIVEFDLRLDAAGGSDFDLIVIDNGAPEVGFQLEAQGVVTWDEDIVDSTSIETPTGLTLGPGWTHVRLSLVVEGAALKGELLLDGNRRALHTFEAKVFTNSTAPELFLGDDSVQSASNPWRVLVDNFTVDAH
jgi:hypothetical protein